jgi:hypothetical protein
MAASLSFPNRRLRPIPVPSVLSALRRRYSTNARALCKLIFSALSTNRSNSALSLLVIVPSLLGPASKDSARAFPKKLIRLSRYPELADWLYNPSIKLLERLRDRQTVQAFQIHGHALLLQLFVERQNAHVVLSQQHAEI